MNARLPQYLLLAEGASNPSSDASWRFVLCCQDTGETFTASDEEPEEDADRLALLALVRGLEAIGEAACVNLVTPNRAVRYGVEQGLDLWKANAWKWERFGRLVTIRDCDLWRRVDRALQIHQLDGRSWRLSDTDRTTETDAPAERADRLPRRPEPAFEGGGSPSPEAFYQEPALLVVRKPKKTLRIDQRQCLRGPTSRNAQTAAV